ncbi:PIN-like domain-containing protein [Streptomyces sp. NPDC001980]|uniref:PIN-like domain-containing protein n=1 Tax=Streptomyces sp. NPDC001980 TaxID=3157126 RepID=UPI0033251F3B
MLTRGLVAPDANVLLNLYRYTEQARGDLLRALGGLENRLWAPRPSWSSDGIARAPSATPDRPARRPPGRWQVTRRRRSGLFAPGAIASPAQGGDRPPPWPAERGLRRRTEGDRQSRSGRVAEHHSGHEHRPGHREAGARPRRPRRGAAMPGCRACRRSDGVRRPRRCRWRSVGSEGCVAKWSTSSSATARRALRTGLAGR